MKPTDENTALMDNYYSLLKNLSSDNKLKLIARLSKSMRSSKKVKREISLSSLYGSWVSGHSADELITELKNARTFNRKRENLWNNIFLTLIFCIYFLKGQFDLHKKIEEIGEENYFLTEITIAELKFGVENS